MSALKKLHKNSLHYRVFRCAFHQATKAWRIKKGHGVCPRPFVFSILFIFSSSFLALSRYLDVNLPLGGIIGGDCDLAGVLLTDNLGSVSQVDGA